MKRIAEGGWVWTLLGVTGVFIYLAFREGELWIGSLLSIVSPSHPSFKDLTDTAGLSAVLGTINTTMSVGNFVLAAVGAAIAVQMRTGLRNEARVWLRVAVILSTVTACFGVVSATVLPTFTLVALDPVGNPTFVGLLFAQGACAVVALLCWFFGLSDILRVPAERRAPARRVQEVGGAPAQAMPADR